MLKINVFNCLCYLLNNTKSTSYIMIIKDTSKYLVTWSYIKNILLLKLLVQIIFDAIKTLLRMCKFKMLWIVGYIHNTESQNMALYEQKVFFGTHSWVTKNSLRRGIAQNFNVVSIWCLFFKMAERKVQHLKKQVYLCSLYRYRTTLGW